MDCRRDRNLLRYKGLLSEQRAIERIEGRRGTEDRRAKADLLIAIIASLAAAFKGTIHEECVYGVAILYKNYNIQALDLL